MVKQFTENELNDLIYKNMYSNYWDDGINEKQLVEDINRAILNG